MVLELEPQTNPNKPEQPELTPLEQFLETRKLVFIAPDVPPVQSRSRHSGRDDQIPDLPMDDAPAEERPETSSRRRTRRRSGESRDRDNERPRVEAPAAPTITEPQKLRGSTRLEAKRQRRREGREAGRRRHVITESEFLARREAVDRSMVVRSVDDRVQIGVLEDKVLVEHYVARSSESSLIGNVYLGKVQNVLPSMEAAFVDIGRGRNAVLYSGEVDWSEYEGSMSSRKIEHALSPGDKVLVQVTKDPVGHKGARLTSQISLPGRFLVYVPGGSMNGISRKLPDTERARLKKILKEVLPNGAGVIVRTAAEGASEDHLTRDVQRLTKQWESIQKRTAKDSAPSLLHSESDMLIKIVRDVFNEDFQKMIISGDDTFDVISGYLEQIAPELCERLEKFDGDKDIFDSFRITEQIAKALDRKVWLPSGGSLVIDRTEAMTVVDVNTGKFVGSGGNLEETVTKNNLEAAEEIVRQLRLRDIGGIIVVDFIDMVLESNRDLVQRRLIECLGRDRTKHQVAEVTSLGLVQMTRKKLGLGLLESFSDPCEACAGRGLIVHHEPTHREPTNTRNSGNRRRNQNSAQGSQQPHAITDEAKSMLAAVAASTIHAASAETKDSDDSAADARGGNDGGSDSSKAKDESRGGTSRQSTSQHLASQRNASRGEPKQSSRGRVTAAAQKTSAPLERTETQNAVGSAPVEEPRVSEASRDATPIEQVRDAKKISSPDDLLGSVLDALPEAPEAGESRLRSRRASRIQQGVSAKDILKGIEQTD